MITITRSLIRTLRTVFRRAGIKVRSGSHCPVLFQPDADDLLIQACSADAAVQYRVPAVAQSERLVVPFDWLDATEARVTDLVTLESRQDDKIVVQRADHGIPQMLVYDQLKPAELPRPSTKPSPCGRLPAKRTS